MKHLQVKRLTYLAAAATLGAVGLMVLSIVSPKPIFLVLAMSVGQGLGTLSLAAYLLAIALDLNISAALADQVEEEVGEMLDEKSHE
ncbi:MAG TPA: hypothetical protein VFR85_06880 [Anaeromyxobacteraceae bacterium]|nr:hypothetical protein [Anaeromyxobacteraceae bacterium]